MEQEKIKSEELTPSQQEAHTAPAGEAQKSKSSDYAHAIQNLYAGGLLLVILVLMQGFLALPSFDTWIFISMVASAMAIPPLSGVLVVNFVEKYYPYAPVRSPSSKAAITAFSIGSIAALVAIATAFGHISWLVLVTFIISVLFTFIIYGLYVSHLDERP
jgi:hypothetical protein